MFYIVKKRYSENYEIIEAECLTHKVWVNALGIDRHFEYKGINEDEGNSFDSREIIKKSRAKTKQKVMSIYPEYFL